MSTHSTNTSASPLLKAYFRVADAWARTILSNPLTVAHGIRGEKGGAGIEMSYFIYSAYHGALRLARFHQNFESREIRDPLQPITPKIPCQG